MPHRRLSGVIPPTALPYSVFFPPPFTQQQSDCHYGRLGVRRVDQVCFCFLRQRGFACNVNMGWHVTQSVLAGCRMVGKGNRPFRHTPLGALVANAVKLPCSLNGPRKPGSVIESTPTVYVAKDLASNDFCGK